MKLSIQSIDKLFIFSLPLLDLGFLVNGIPFRLIELVFFLSIFRIVFIQNEYKIRKRDGVLIGLLLINFLYVSFYDSGMPYNTSFRKIYLFRNLFYTFILTSVLIKPLNLEVINGDRIVNYIIIFLGVFYVLEFINVYVLDFGYSKLFASYQSDRGFRNGIYPLSSSASEPAYVVPLLMLCVFYYLANHNYKMLIPISIMVVCTASSFGYFAFLGVIFMWISREIKKSTISLRFVFKLVVPFFFLVLFFLGPIIEILSSNYQKLFDFITLNLNGDWSAMQRSGQLISSFKILSQSDLSSLIFGNGTGYYSYYMIHMQDTFEVANEAHNLFLSTLVDRGLFGFILLSSILFVILKQKKDLFLECKQRILFDSLKVALFVSVIHWFLTGMLWKTYFWVEVSILLSLSPLSKIREKSK